MTPFDVKTNLLKHQEDAVEKVLPIRVGALFMDMGTGKSRTAIELVHRRQKRISKVVWFCPVGTKGTIKEQILTHTTATDIEELKPASWHIVGIESVSSSVRVVSEVAKIIDDKTFVIVDESSFIKGHNSMRTQRITRLSQKARYRLILTGTPISQGVVDLYGQFNFLSSGILGYTSFYSFARNHLEYSDKYKGQIVRSHNEEYIASKIAPYTYQVKKEECITLPEKTYSTRYCYLSREQRDAYDDAKAEILDSFTEEEDEFAILRLFNALQQICSGFWNRRLEYNPNKRDEEKKYEFLTYSHDRVNTLLEVVEEIPKDQKVIVWAKFQHDIEQILPELEKLGGVAQFHGGTKDRDSEIAKFRGGARFFLATASTGGHGLTLNEASYVIFYNNGFKYSERLQAEDRCHRIGQTKNVHYVDIVCAGTIDDRIMDALHKKGSVVTAFRREIAKVKNKKGKLKDLIKAL